MSARPVQKLIQTVRDRFENDSHGWGLSTINALTIAVVPILIMTVMVAMIPLSNLFVWITAENSLLEWLQFLLVFGSSLIFARLSLFAFKSSRPYMGALWLLIALATFFVAGEEIAWGQQIFNWKTPDALAAVNVQQETTLHNISTAHTVFVYAAMLGGLYGTVMPFFGSLRSNKQLPSGLRNLLIPPLCLVPAFFMPFAYRFSRLFLGVDHLLPRFLFHVTKFSEVTELCLYFGLMVFAWLNLRQSHSIASWSILQLASDEKFEG